MKISFLGTGSAFTLKNFNSSILIEEDGCKLLFDAGTDIRFSLEKKGLSYKDINMLYLTHAHADHCGGLEYLAYCTYFDPTCHSIIQLMGDFDLLQSIWKECCGGLRLMLNESDYMFHPFFEIYPYTQIKNMKFKPIQTMHVMNQNKIGLSYGLEILYKDSIKVFLSGDSILNPLMIPYFKECDLIIHDCETYNFKSGVHAHYEDLRLLPTDIKKKMVLVHYNDNIMEDKFKIKDEWLIKCKEDNFYEFATIEKEIKF